MFRHLPVSLLAALVFVASPGAAQTIPIPFPDDRELRHISVVVDKGITRTVDLPNRALREARLALLAKKVVPDEQLAALAEAGDGLAAATYVDILVGRGLRENASDVAYFGAIAVGTGRVWPLDEVVEAMVYLDPATEPKKRKNQLIKVLYPHAWAGNSVALQAVIDFNGEGRLFGKMSNSTRQKVLEQAEKTGNGRAELRMALGIMEAGNITASGFEDARSLLTRAKTSHELPIKTTAANLLVLLDERQKQASASN